MDNLKDEKKKILSTDICYDEKVPGITRTPGGYVIIKEPYVKHKKLV